MGGLFPNRPSTISIKGIPAITVGMLLHSGPSTLNSEFKILNFFRNMLYNISKNCSFLKFFN